MCTSIIFQFKKVQLKLIEGLRRRMVNLLQHKQYVEISDSQEATKQFHGFGVI